MKLLESLWFIGPSLALAACGEAEGQGAYETTDTESSGATSSGGEDGSSSGAAGESGSSGAGASADVPRAGSGGTSSGCNPSSSGAGIAIPASCEPLNQCLLRACGESYTQCLGTDYVSGDYSGGACAGVFQCVQECNCEPECSEGCYANDEACVGCLAGLVLCGYECEDELAACQG